MNYIGKLYGKVGNQYFPMEATSEDYDKMQQRIQDLEAEAERLKGLAPSPPSDKYTDGILRSYKKR